MSEADDLDIPPRILVPRQLSAGIKPLLVLAKLRGIMDAFTLSEPELTLGEIRRPDRLSDVDGAAAGGQSGGRGVS